MVLGRNDKGLFYSGAALFSMGMAIPVIYYTYKCYAHYCAATGRTLLGRGLVTTPEGVRKLMMLAKAKKIENVPRRLFTGSEEFSIFSKEVLSPIDSTELPAILALLRQIVPVIEETEFISSEGRKAKSLREEAEDYVFPVLMMATLCRSFNNAKVRIISCPAPGLSSMREFIETVVKVIRDLNEGDLNNFGKKMREKGFFSSREKYRVMLSEGMTYTGAYLALMVASELRAVSRRMTFTAFEERRVLYSTRFADRNPPPPAREEIPQAEMSAEGRALFGHS